MARKKPAPAPPPDDDMQTLSQLWESHDPGRVSRGVYSIYKTDDGGMHIAYRPEDTGEDLHMPIPAMLMQMLMAASEGKGPMGRLRSMAMARMGG